MRMFILPFWLTVSGSVFAQACDIPELSGENIPGAREYSIDHRIWLKGTGYTSASDSLWVWPSNEGSMCFFFFTMTHNLHYCSLGGEMKEAKSGTYEYKDATCSLRLTVSDKMVRAAVKATKYSGPKGRNNFCQPEGKWGCGDYTGISSGIYRFFRANPAVQRTGPDGPSADLPR